MIAKKLLKSKKGGIPAINEVVMTFLKVTPKPILYLIFILLIGTISMFVVPALLNLFGWECLDVNGELHLFQVPIQNIVSKTFLNIGEYFNQAFGFKEYQIPEDPFPDGDKHFQRIPEICWVTSTLNGSTIRGLSGACLRCQTNANFFQWFIITTDTNAICIEDATRSNIVTNNDFCTICQLPDNYYYNHTYCVNQTQYGNPCYYRILDDSELPDENYAKGIYYNKIIQLGGVERQQDSSEFVNVQCEAASRPQLYFYTIKIFDRELWILLFVSWALISFASLWYGMVGLH